MAGSDGVGSGHAHSGGPPGWSARVVGLNHQITVGIPG